MLKNFFLLLALSMFVLACNTDASQKTEKQNQDEAQAELATLKVEDFESMAADFVGKEVHLVGTVDHVCKHSGKRMVIFGDENPEITVKIESGEISQFDREIEGSEVSVNAVVTELRMDETYLHEWEEEVKQNHADEEDQGAEQLANIQSYRDMLAETEEDHLSFYGLDCLAFEILKEEEPVEAQDEAVKEEKKESEETK